MWVNTKRSSAAKDETFAVTSFAALGRCCTLKSENRKLSEKYGLKVWLCLEHHTVDNGVHNNAYLDDELKKQAEIKWLLYDYDRSINDFIKIFGKNYL